MTGESGSIEGKRSFIMQRENTAYVKHTPGASRTHPGLNYPFRNTDLDPHPPYQSPVAKSRSLQIVLDEEAGFLQVIPIRVVTSPYIGSFQAI